MISSWLLQQALGREHRLVVEAEGELPIPPPLASRLGLVPGDLVALTPAPLSLHLEIYREFLADEWTALSPAARGRFLGEFLSRPLAAVDGRGVLGIPPRVFPLTLGDRLVLQVARTGLHHTLYLLRAAS